MSSIQKKPTEHDIAGQLAACKSDLALVRNSLEGGKKLSPPGREKSLSSLSDTWSGPPEKWLTEPASLREVDEEIGELDDAVIPVSSESTEPSLSPCLAETSQELKRPFAAWIPPRTEIPPASDHTMNVPSYPTSPILPYSASTSSRPSRIYTSMRRTASPSQDPHSLEPTNTSSVASASAAPAPAAKEGEGEGETSLLWADVAEKGHEKVLRLEKLQDRRSLVEKGKGMVVFRPRRVG